MSVWIGRDSAIDPEAVAGMEEQGMSKGLVGVTSRSPWQVLGWLGSAAALIFAYRIVMVDLWYTWATNQDYSYGMVVAPFAAYLVWRKRGDLARLKPTPSWIGAGLLIAAAAMRVAGLLLWYGSLERVSLIVAVAGVVLLLGGRRIMWLMKGPLLFLLLMIPLPGRVALAVTLPLQRLAAVTSAWVLSIMGWEAISEGNVIRLPGQNLAVAEACNGLRMVFAIVTLGCAIAYLARRPLWERITVACSSVVIGIAANVGRIVATGAISQAFDTASTAQTHDIAGWLMMPLALMLIWGEQRFLRSLFLDEPAGVGDLYD